MQAKRLKIICLVMKNMVYMQYPDNYTAGESAKVYALRPVGMQTDLTCFISQEAVTKGPYENR